MVAVLEGEDVLPVGDDEPFESHLVAEDVGQHVVRGMHRDVVDRGTVRHRRGDTGIDARLERTQEGLLQVAERNLRHGAVMAGDRLRVAGEVLVSGRDHWMRGIVALEALDGGRTQDRVEDGILTEGLVVAAVAGIARDLEHRREGPSNTHGCCASSGGRLAVVDQCGVGGRAHADAVRENLGAEHIVVAMHRVVAIDDRDMQPRILDRVLLQGIDIGRPAIRNIRAGNVTAPREQGAGAIGDQRLLHPGLGKRKVRVDLDHLPDFLADVHLSEQGVDPALDRVGAVQPGCGGIRRRGVESG